MDSLAANNVGDRSSPLDMVGSWLPDLPVIDCKNGYEEKGQEGDEVQTKLRQEGNRH